MATTGDGSMRRLPLHLARLLPALPLLRLAWGLLRNDTGILTARPVEHLIDACGWWALACLTASLAITPLRRFLGGAGAIRLRRPLGLWAFAYACLHLSAYVGLAQGFSLGDLRADAAKHPFVWLGLATWLCLLPLALTSTRGWQRRLGPRWVRLHRLAYLAGGLAVAHFAWQAKAGWRDPGVLALGLPMALLLGLRIPGSRRPKAQAQ